MPLCRLHVRPHLPINTLSPINIPQISDTIWRIQMKLSGSCRRRVRSARSKLRSRCCAAHLSFAGVNTLGEPNTGFGVRKINVP